jgi:LysM repeat protein
MAAKRVLQVFMIVLIVLVSLAATRPALAWSACGSTYTVRYGDWLAKIARYCGVTLADLRAANPWTYNYYYLYPGQVLVIPYSGGGPYPHPHPWWGHGCGPGSDAYGSYYVVCRGDTLGRIAAYYGMNWHYLAWNNDIVNPNLIYAGQIIRPY